MATPPSGQTELPPDNAAVPPVLETVRAALEAGGVHADDRHAIELALAEGLNNAILHGCRGRADARVGFRWHIEPSRFCAEIRDPGSFDADQAADRGQLPDDPAREGGRGLYLMGRLADRVAHQREDGHHVLRLEKKLTPPSGASDDTAQALDEAVAEIGAAYETIDVLLGMSDALARAEPPADFERRAIERLHRRFPELRLTVWTLDRDERAIPEAGDPPGPADRELRDAVAQTFAKPTEVLGERPAGRPLFALPCTHQGEVTAVLTATRAPGPKFFGSAELAVLRATAGLLGAARTGARALEARERKLRFERELEIAAAIQSSLIPKTLPSNARWDLHGLCELAQEVGGDFFDAIPLRDGALLVAIADVMGKGISAALVASSLRSALRAHAESSSDPGGLLTSANRAIAPDLVPLGIFVTACLLRLPPDDSPPLAACAGHPPPILHRRAGSSGMTVAPKGIPLGILADYAYRSEAIPCGPGDTLLLFTDGLYERGDATGEQPTDLLPLLPPHPSSHPPAALAARLFERTGNTGHQPPRDDRTLVVIRRRTTSHPAPQ